MGGRVERSQVLRKPAPFPETLGTASSNQVPLWSHNSGSVMRQPVLTSRPLEMRRGHVARGQFSWMDPGRSACRRFPGQRSDPCWEGCEGGRGQRGRGRGRAVVPPQQRLLLIPQRALELDGPQGHSESRQEAEVPSRTTPTPAPSTISWTSHHMQDATGMGYTVQQGSSLWLRAVLGCEPPTADSASR